MKKRTTKLKKFKRNCPECNKDMFYSNKYTLEKAIRDNSNCKHCANSGENNAMYVKSGQANPMYGRKHSNETKEEMSRIRKGRKASSETKKKLSDMRRGEKHPNYGKHHSEETRAKISKAHMGKTISKETKEKISKTSKVIPKHKQTEETKRKISKAHKGKKLTDAQKEKIREGAHYGENNHAWKGGITPLNRKIRTCFKYEAWRDTCYKRDNYLCQQCKIKRNDLHCHHIIHFADIRKEYNIRTLEQSYECFMLWDINNGITLCEDCHLLAHNKIRK